MANIVSTLRYDADFSSAMAQAKALAGQIGVLNMAFNSLDKSALRARNSMAEAFAGQISSMGGFTTQMVNLTSQTEKFGKALANNKLTMREYFAEAYRGYTRQSSMMKQLAREQVKFQEAIAIPVGRNAAGQMQGLMAVPTQVDFKNASTRMKLLSQEFGIFNQLVRNGADELINMGKNTQWTGRQLTVGLTMPVVLFGATFAKTFMDIDKQMTRFAKVYGQDVIGTSAAATEQMKQQVMDLAETISSRFGVAAKETVALAADVAATGKEGQDLLKTVEQTNRLAVLGEVDRQEAMKATLAIQTAFKQNTDELAESINFLNAIENQTSTTLNDLVEAIPKAGPVVKGLGGSIKDLSVLMVAMKEGGIPAAEAANAIKSGLASLINPTKKASEVAKQFGVDLVGIVEANKGQLMPTIMAVQGALNGLDSFSKSKVIEEIFGKYQFARISALFNNLGKAGSQTQQAMELAGASTTELAGIANKELKAYTESTTVRFQRMVETVKNQLIPMGASLLEMLTPALDKLSGIIDVVKNAVGNLPDFLKEPLKILGGFALFAGPILMLVGLFKNLIGNSIKFAMSVVSLGARIGGIDVRKFELLDAETAAANIQVDNLTTSFAEQTGILKNLNREMSNYLTALSRVATQSPNMMVRKGPTPIRRAAGSRGPEMVPGGYGGGDKIPALLEPGEMVVTKEAASKYGSIISAMNRGTLPGFQDGLDKGTDTRHGQNRLKSDVFVLRNLGQNISSPGGLSGILSISARNIVDVTSLYVKEIAAAAGTSVSAINIQMAAWKKANIDLLTKFNQELALAIEAGDLVEQQRLISEVHDKFVRDMKAAGGPVERFARQAEVMFPELAQDLTDTQRIIKQTELNLNSAEDASRFYSENMGKTALLSRLGQPGSYRAPAAAAAAALPMLPGVTSSTYMSTYGIPAQFMDPEIRASRGSSYGISSESQRLSLLRAGTSAEHVARTVAQLETYAQNVGEQLVTEQVQGQTEGATRAIRPGSPSRAAMEQFNKLGESLGQGALLGLKTGFQSAIAGKATQSLILPGQNMTPTGPLTLPGAAPAHAGPLIDPRNMSLGPTVSTIYGPTGFPMAITGPRGETERIRRPVDLGMPAMPEKTPSVADNERRSLMGGGAMNAMFGLSMAASTVTMFGDQTSEATQALSKFSMGLMAVSSLMMLMPSKMPTNLLGLGTLGGKMAGAGAARAAAGAGRLGATALMKGGAALSMLGGPVGIAAGIGITAAIAGFVMYKKAAEEARQRAISAFADPAKTAEYFGKKMNDVTESIKQTTLELQAGAENVSEIDDSLREAVRQDYAPLIERLRYSTAAAGAQQLAVAFSKMVASGLSADEAKSAIQAIAEEAGAAGGAAYGVAMKESMIREMTPDQAIENVVKLFSPGQNLDIVASIRKDRDAIQKEIDAMGPDNKKPLVDWDWILDDQEEKLRDLYNQLDQANNDINQLTNLTSDQMVGATEQLFLYFEQSPREAINAFRDLAQQAESSVEDLKFSPDAIKDYLKELDQFSGETINKLIGTGPEAEKRANQVLEAISAKITPREIADILSKSGFDGLRVEIDLAINVQEAKNQVDAAKQAVMDLASETGIMGEALAKGQQRLSNLMTQREKKVKGFEDDAEAMAEAFEKQQQAAEDEINALEKEQAQIEKSADSYINSIEKRQKADKFYADQRKSSLDALSALAEGDVFGFLTARNEMQANAADYAYEQEIGRIEERKNLENEAIQARIDKKQEEMDLASRAHDAAMKAIEDDKASFIASQDEKIAKQKTSNEEMSKLIDGIKNGEIEAIDAVKEHFSKAAAKKYEDAVKYQMKETYGLLQQQIIAGDVSAQQAGFELQKMMNALFPRAQSGAFNVGQSLQETLTYLGLTPFNTAPRPNATNVGGLASGGAVRGPGTPTSDSIPAYLSNGEYVIRASSVDKYGVGFMDALNAGHFAQGGVVEGYGEQQSRRAGARFVGKRPLGGNATEGTTAGGTGSPDGIAAVKYAQAQIGDSYSGTPSPPDSWGCSTLTAWAYNMGVPNGGKKYGLPTYSESQINASRITARRASGTAGDGSAPAIPYGSMNIGDIVYFKNTGLKPSGRHVGLYAGNGQMIHAGNPVGYSSLSGSMWNRQYFDSAGTPIAKFAKGGMVGRMFGAGRISSPSMPRYNMGGPAAVNSGNSMYNININANGIKDPMIVADMVIKKIDAENSRRSHSRVI